MTRKQRFNVINWSLYGVTTVINAVGFFIIESPYPGLVALGFQLAVMIGVLTEKGFISQGGPE